MPYRELLEEYPLYRKLKKCPWYTLDKVAKPSIHMPCPTCGAEQTFLMGNDYFEGSKTPDQKIEGAVARAVYVCAGCRKFLRIFLIKFGEEKDYVMKVGQYPAWTIAVEPDLQRMLGPHLELYRKGLVCESQGYGIGAFAYYRRIVENIIDELLAGIAELMSGEDLKKYSEALEKTKATRVAQEKIELVKDLLPPGLRPEGMNPLGVLHKSLSEGLHEESDEKCMELAGSIREVLVFLSSQVSVHKSYSKRFTEGMKKLLGGKKEPVTENSR